MRPYNFGAGPTALPAAVLEEAQEGLRDWKGTGQSVMELSFTGEAYQEIYHDCVGTLRRLLKLPEGYQILLMQGGAYGQFSILPMNLMGKCNEADYAVTGHWSQRAAKEAAKYGRVTRVNPESQNCENDRSEFNCISQSETWRLNPNAAYCHITTNETANGLQFKSIPKTGDVPLIADMTSDFLIAPLDLSEFGVVYASAQKNGGIAGLTTVIIDDALLSNAMEITPSVFNYQALSDSSSKVNTPPVWSIYLSSLVYQWIESEGGLKTMAERNQEKSASIYQVIDEDDFYQISVHKDYRSSVNICFNLPSPELESLFITEALNQGFINLKGHSAFGGVRVSLYNATTLKAVAALKTYMEQFRQRCG